MNKVITVYPLLHQHLFVEMADGQCGEFDMTPYLESDFFSALKDDAYFKQVTVFFRGVGWPNGQDIGPDTIEAGLVKSKKSLFVGGLATANHQKQSVP